MSDPTIIHVHILQNDDGVAAWLSRTDSPSVDPDEWVGAITADQWERFQAASKAIEELITEAVLVTPRNADGGWIEPCPAFVSHIRAWLKAAGEPVPEEPSDLCNRCHYQRSTHKDRAITADQWERFQAASKAIEELITEAVLVTPRNADGGWIEPCPAFVSHIRAWLKAAGEPVPEEPSDLCNRCHYQRSTHKDREARITKER